MAIRATATLLLVAASTAWPLRRDVSPRLRKLVNEAVQAGQDAARAQEGFPSLLDIFMSPNATSLQRKDWGRHLALAFENFRVPAALVAGTALAGAFALPPTADDTVLTGVSKRLYLLFSIASFMSSMVTVALATSALVELNERDSGRDSTAENLEDFISRSSVQLGRERWAAVNAHFTAGVMWLCCAVGLRCYTAFADRAFGRIAAMIVASGALIALSLGLPGGIVFSIAARHAASLVRRALDWRNPSPALMLAVLLSCSATCLTVRELWVYIAARNPVPTR